LGSFFCAYNVTFSKVRASGFVDEGRGIDSECGSDSEGGKDGACLDTSDDEELVVKVIQS
jgi:hypothetical protein